MAKRTATNASTRAIKKGGNIERFLALSDAEKRAEVAVYERGVPESELSDLTPSERARWERATRAEREARSAAPAKPSGGGRVDPATSGRDVQVTIEGDLLARADAYAEQHKMNRSELVALGLKLALATGAKRDGLLA